MQIRHAEIIHVFFFISLQVKRSRRATLVLKRSKRNATSNYLRGSSAPYSLSLVTYMRTCRLSSHIENGKSCKLPHRYSWSDFNHRRSTPTTRPIPQTARFTRNLVQLPYKLAFRYIRQSTIADQSTTRVGVSSYIRNSIQCRI